RAAEAQKLHEAMNHPSDEALGKLLDNGDLLDCPLTSRDLHNARTIFGPCSKCIAGKATNHSNPQSTSEPSHAPGELLHMDIVFINRGAKQKRLPFLLAVDDYTNYVMARRLPSKTTESVGTAMTAIMDAYAGLNLTVKRIRTDPENVFRSCEQIVNSRGCQMEFTAVGQHERRVERYTRILKERVRIMINSQRYRLPPELFPYAVLDVAATLNMTPNSRCSPRSPRQVVTRTKISRRKDVGTPFGRVAAFKVPGQPTSNSDLDPRTEIGIVVGRERNSNGNLLVFLLHNKQVVSRHRPIPIILTEDIISMINAMSSATGASPDSEVIQLSGEAAQAVDDHSPPADIEPPDYHRGAEQERNRRGAEEETTTGASDVSSPENHVEPASAVGDTSPLADDVTSPVHNPETITHVDTAPEPSSDDTSTAASPDAPPNAPVASPRYNLRPRRSHWRDKYGLHMSLKRAMKDRPKEAMTSARLEIQQMIDRKVWKRPVKYVSPEERRNVIHSSFFLKDKYLANGDFEKFKSRLVAGGNEVNREGYLPTDTSSPTVRIESLFTVLSIAAHKKMELGNIDFPGAYLNVKLKKRQLMRLSPDVAAIAVDIDPSLRDSLQADDSLIVELDSALYGLPVSGALWYEDLAAHLITSGYTRSSADRCIFYKRDGKDMILLALYVDDLLHASTSRKLSRKLTQCLKDKYGNITMHSGDELSFVGLLISQLRDDGKITVKQPAYTEDVFRAIPVHDTAKTPATKNLLLIDPESPPIDKSAYLSDVMKLMFLATRTRPDILMPVTVLATRSNAPTESDRRKLEHVVKYLRLYPDEGIVFQPDEIQAHASIDASHGVHPDARSHTGIKVSIGRRSAPIYCKSRKQKSVAPSSTAAEIIACSDSILFLIWLASLLDELGFPQRPIPVEQDNKSAIFLAENGFSKSGRARHIHIRYQYVCEQINNKLIELIYTPTAELCADILTK
ncbi:unnamed protein product, partial [Ectocarpus fasciculatus]